MDISSSRNSKEPQKKAWPKMLLSNPIVAKFRPNCLRAPLAAKSTEVLLKAGEVRTGLFMVAVNCYVDTFFKGFAQLPIQCGCSCSH
jgi:hypothetical protein